MQSPSQSSPPQVNLRDVPLQRRLRIAVSLSYAGDGEKAAHVFRDWLQQAASSRGLPVDFAFSMAGVPEAQQKVAPPPASAEVFVAFLTPDYASGRGPAEFEEYLASAGERGPGFGLRFQDTDWEKLPGIRNLHLLPSAWPDIETSTGFHPERGIAVAVEEFLDVLLDQGVIPPFGAPQDEEAHRGVDEDLFTPWELSPGAQFILDRAAAQTLEQDSDLALDTASVLLALIENEPADGAPQWAGHWAAREMANARKRLRDRSRTGSGPLYPADLHPPVSAGLGAALNEAKAIAQKTSGAATIHARHLLAAVLCDRRGTGSRALGIIADAGFDVARLRLAFYDFVRGGPDDDEAWGRILLGEITEAPKLSDFHADDSHSEDYLDVRPDVLAFAGLIAARTLKPPLSIGLFGEWGSGKTFFMRMLRREIDRLAAEADASGEMQRDLPFYKRIIQIEFNAWHYVEGNLWASLVQHIFDNLRFADEPRLSASQELQEHLLLKIGHRRQEEEQAQREKEQARQLVEAAREELKTARAAFETQATELAGLSGRNVLADLEVTDIRERVAGVLDTLGMTELGPSAQEMRSALGEARALLSRASLAFAPLLHGDARERASRWTRLLIVLLAGPAAALAAAVVLNLLGAEGIEGIGAAAAGAAALLARGAPWLRAQVETAGGWIQAVEDAQRRLEERIAAEQAANEAKIREAEERLRLHEADYHSAHRKEEEAQRQVAAAEQRLKEASIPTVLNTFIEDRANSDDYRKHLGTLALVRTDFERLSELIEEENWRLEPPVPDEDTSRRGLKKFESAEDEARDRARRVNRIVLYIDDLDRCPPAKVVEVLQAVHLLLAFPLFVVVVGVDARWVTRSLEARYRDLLGEKKDQRPGEFDELLGSASAHDYLEKIFQVPFWLRAMGEGASRRMMEGLLASSLVADAEDAESGRPEHGSGTRPEAAETEPVATGSAEAPASHAPEAPAAAHDDRTAAAEKKEEDEDSVREAPELSAESLEIRAEELAFMRELAPLLGRSPRALKRFVNVYRLVKAGLSPYQRRVFTSRGAGMGDYRAVLFLLAVDTGAPRAAAPLLRVLQEAPPPGLRDVVDRVRPAPSEAADWRRVREWLERPDGLALADDVPALARAARRVRRFSFHTGRVGDSPAPEADRAAAPDPEPAAAEPPTARA